MDSRLASAALPARVPRFVRHLNEYAQARGVEVEVYVGPYSNDPELRLWSNWRTTRERFLALDILTPANRLPLKRGLFTVPMVPKWRPERALLAGDISVAGENVLWEIDFGPPNYEIEERAGVEIVRYAAELVYHGTGEDLIACGIDRRHLPLGKAASKSDGIGNGYGRKWRARRQPDGMLVYRTETDADFHARVAKRTRDDREYTQRVYGTYRQTGELTKYLKLVVDNTRGAELNRGGFNE